ncbi:MAG: hypothetical protein ACD_44C00481G0004 [uncultured bacterium]|nr:MAG: hypothetical protein ACD_44C00481G0004 [uncultured bacterium]OGT15256.1 MAG: hypothetical protein A3B69_02545 [Gammaproteobacteria bacterium RIFCSPHIGHO2_02_FULL_38_33]OGT23927.1 MAG: hypothetical protein A2W47_01725 [Gammaproteobacteria bacterium RIFCSPHIGHO2_12_38_15]OGT67749.1 MAG: hypothetical protein A3I12_03680 [Gammaproteobacteria bacterium RIFCSPLOWO2_02_FULL_38_11]
MLIKQKNCLAANLCPVIVKQQVSLEALFWALVDIDDINYEKYTMDWVPCYLTELGIYQDTLWSSFQVFNLNDLQQQFIDKPQGLHLIVVPIKNVAYRHDLGNLTYQQSTRHALLIHHTEPLLLEDLTIGVTGEAYPATSLLENQFIFPFTYWKFDSVTFVNHLFSIDLQQKTNAYARQLINRAIQTRALKHQLIMNAVQKNDLKMLACANLYEESYYYRIFFISQQPTGSDLYAHHEQYKHLLSQFKGQFLRMQNCSSSSEMQHLQNKAGGYINQLSELDHEFYQTFTKYIKW